MTTREEIIALAEECGFVSLDIEIIADKAVPMFESFFHAAQRQAYERAAKCCDARYMGDNNREDMEAKRCAEAIRSMEV